MKILLAACAVLGLLHPPAALAFALVLGVNLAIGYAAERWVA